MSDFGAIKEWMDYGNSHRMTAATMMNQRSSRSHAIFTIKMTMVRGNCSEMGITVFMEVLKYD